MVRRASKKAKGQKQRRERKLIVVATEGRNKTEISYLKMFNRTQKQYKIVSARGNDTDPESVVDDAIKAVEREDLDFSRGDRAVALVDTDFGKDAQLRAAKDKAITNNVEVLMSNPCFEVWFLQHFRYSTKGYNSSDEVIEELLSFWPKYRKNLNDYSELFHLTEDALNNADKLRQYHKKVDPEQDTSQSNPSTDVDMVVRVLVESK